MPSTPPTSPKNRKKHWLPHKRTRIAALFSVGFSAAEIAEKEGLSRWSAYGIKNRYKVQKSAVSLPGRGRPPKLSPRDKRHIIRLIEQDHFISGIDLARGVGLKYPYRLSSTG
jgi:transposase